MNIRTLILEDDIPARERIRSLLAEEQDVEVIAESAGEESAVDRIIRDTVDLVFLDAGLCGQHGFEVLRAMDPPRATAVIVVAADAEYTLAAFEAHALDYLLRPVEEGRFKRSLQRARDFLEARTDSKISQQRMRLLQDIESAPQYLTRLKVKSADRIMFLRVEQIDWLEASDNYVILHVGKQTHIVREKLGALEAALDPERFFRISRSALVNIAHISELRATFRGEHVVVLREGSRLPMTRGIDELEELVAFC